MKRELILFLIIVLTGIVTESIAQENRRVYFTTGAGLIKSPGSLHHVFNHCI